MDYQTGEDIREATEEELAASIEAQDRDGGAGVIVVEGRSCYVED
jgi:predicted  nucleic acid-binding Zn-ribbon protein